MLISYILLFIAIAFAQVAGALMPATEGFTKIKTTVTVLACYAICFFAFGHALKGIDLGIAYATWGATSTIVLPILCYILYRHKITKIGVVALGMIVCSVVTLNLYG